MFSRVTDDELIAVDSEVAWFMIIDKKVPFFLSRYLVFKVGGVLCNASAGHHHRRTSLPVPMRLLKWGSLSILCKIGIHGLFSCVEECFQFRKLLHFRSILVVVWGSWLSILRFLCIVEAG